MFSFFFLVFVQEIRKKIIFDQNKTHDSEQQSLLGKKKVR